MFVKPHRAMAYGAGAAGIAALLSAGAWVYCEWSINGIRNKQNALDLLEYYCEHPRQPRRDNDFISINEFAEEEGEGEPNEVLRLRLESDRKYFESAVTRFQTSTMLSVGVALLGATASMFVQRTDSIAEAAAKLVQETSESVRASLASATNELVLLARHYYAEGTGFGYGAKQEVYDALKELNFDRKLLDSCQASHRANFEGYLKCVGGNRSR